ncbi:TPA: hypothetical protein ENX78_07945 [Candidatus Poribacteria bacterium]|nr:hypothetical protein [Candidatus Poribacteria bacterium]
MNRKQYIVLLSSAIIAGLLGGLISGYIFSEKTVIAQEAPQTSTLLQAEQIRLVGSDGKILAVLAVSPDTREPFFAIYSRKDDKYRAMIDIFDGGPRLVLRDVTGQTRVTLGATEVVNKPKGILEKRAVSSLTFFNSNGELIWSAP